MKRCTAEHLNVTR